MHCSWANISSGVPFIEEVLDSERALTSRTYQFVVIFAPAAKTVELSCQEETWKTSKTTY